MGVRTDGTRERLWVRVDRLLQTCGDGQGANYSFTGWEPRRYRTWAVLVAIEGAVALLVLPEWHPGRPVRLPLRLLPQAEVGSWLALRANLAASVAGHLSPSGFACCGDPGVERCHRPSWGAP